MLERCDKVRKTIKKEGGEKVKKLLNISMKCAVLLIAFSVAGYLLIAGSYALPERTIVYNASASTDFLVSQYVGKDMEWMNWPDYYTDMVMLNIASYYEESDSIWTRAAENKKIGHTGEDSYPFDIVLWLSERTPFEKAWYSYNESSSVYEPCFYGKYWNGYLIFLRPLLLYLNMRQIYGISRTVMIALFGLAVLILLIRDRRFVIPFALAFLTLRPFTKFCLTYAVIEILLCIFIIISAIDRRLAESAEKRTVFFFVMGMINAYFTLMSFSFVVPVFCSVYLACSAEENEGRVTKSAKKLAVMMFWYFAGFCSMWAVKWIILAVSNTSLLAGVAESVKQRLSHDDYGEKVSLWDALLWNICGFYYKGEALTWSIWLAVGMAILAIVLSLLKKKMLFTRSDAVLTITALFMIVLRYAAVLNHSRVHYFFMNRLLSGAVFAVLAIEFVAITRGIGKTTKAS